MICGMVVKALGTNQLDRAVGIELWGREGFGSRIDKRRFRSPREERWDLYCRYLSSAWVVMWIKVYIEMYSSCTSVEGVWFFTIVEENGLDWIRDMYIGCDSSSRM
jgi:hypothetical protein